MTKLTLSGGTISDCIGFLHDISEKDSEIPQSDSQPCPGKISFSLVFITAAVFHKDTAPSNATFIRMHHQTTLTVGD